MIESLIRFEPVPIFLFPLIAFNTRSSLIFFIFIVFNLLSFKNFCYFLEIIVIIIAINSKTKVILRIYFQ